MFIKIMIYYIDDDINYSCKRVIFYDDYTCKVFWLNYYLNELNQGLVQGFSMTSQKE